MTVTGMDRSVDPTLAAVLRATTIKALRAAGTHDAIVVGAGAAGGLAALLLVEAGLRVLLLDAGLRRSTMSSLMRRFTGATVRQLSGPVGLSVLHPALIDKARGALRIAGRLRQPVQSRCYAWERAPDAFIDDVDCPFEVPPDRPFVWLRARLLGGRMVIPGHGQQYYRLGPDDFLPQDGLSPPWPLRPGELNPWYSLVERRLGLSGMRDDVPWQPDSEIAVPLELTPAEVALRSSIIARWPGARPVMGRFAPPLNALRAAALTGRLLCRQGAIVREIEVDTYGRVRGVVWHDQRNHTEERASAPLVFLCASSLESTRILLLSRSGRSPDGLGAASGALGRYLMDHVLVRAGGVGPPVSPGPAPEEGRCLYLPRFDAREFTVPGRGRGFGVQLYQIPAGSTKSYFTMTSFAEMLPRPENRVTLDSNRTDAWGIPALHIDCSFSPSELAQARDQNAALRAIAEVAKIKLSGTIQTPEVPGTSIHECGTARMGTDPENSVLDPYNQCWDAQGLYVTDGACFPSQGTQNPTLTILALTARACDHALRIARNNSAT